VRQYGRQSARRAASKPLRTTPPFH
jgi:hypothetical protein